MGGILSAYLFLSLSQTTFPVDADGFMPFQQNYYLWKVIGFGGLLVFQSRWIVQWIYSEKHKESKIPIAFWWLSLAGSILCLLYFLRQQDSVGVAGYVFSVVPYSRNLMLVYAKRRADAAAGFGVAAATSNDAERR